jgi:hypothetical protein
MTQYLISFDDGAMTFPEKEMPDVAKAAHEVVQECVHGFDHPDHHPPVLP